MKEIVETARKEISERENLRKQDEQKNEGLRKKDRWPLREGASRDYKGALLERNPPEKTKGSPMIITVCAGDRCGLHGEDESQTAAQHSRFARANLARFARCSCGGGSRFAVYNTA